MASITVKFTCGDYKKISFTSGGTGFEDAMRHANATEYRAGTAYSTTPCYKHRPTTPAFVADPKNPDLCPHCETECFGDCLLARG